MKTKHLIILIALATTILSCTDENITPESSYKITRNFLVLSQGSYGGNNSSLAYYSTDSTQNSTTFFSNKNGRELGETANDMIKYGSKIYIVVNGSSNVEVINANTGIVEKQIPMYHGTTAKEPRYIVSHGGKVYVSSYDDTVTRIDTTSLEIDGSVTVGEDPEEMCVVGSKLYVANSGGMNYATGNYGNTVSVVDLATFTETKKITVGLNPTKLKADENGNLYVVYNGNYSTDFGGFQKIDAQTENVTTLSNVSASDFEIYNNKVYFYSYDNVIKVMDCATNTVTNSDFVSDDTEFPTGSYIFSINIDSSTNDVYVTTSDYKISGNVYCFDKTGKLKFKINSVGLNPCKILFM